MPAERVLLALRAAAVRGYRPGASADETGHTAAFSPLRLDWFPGCGLEASVAVLPYYGYRNLVLAQPAVSLFPPSFSDPCDE